MDFSAKLQNPADANTHARCHRNSCFSAIPSILEAWQEGVHLIAFELEFRKK
jgi:hypothetical protein